MRYNKLISLFLVFCIACKPTRNASEIIEAKLSDNSAFEDHTVDKLLNELLPDINAMSKTVTAKYFVLQKDFNTSDTNQILLIPARHKVQDQGNDLASAVSDIDNRVIMLYPQQIKEFVLNTSIGDSTDITGYLAMVLLHELGHFIYAIPGNFDEGKINLKKTELGEQDMGTEPIFMSYYKKLELKVDSMAVDIVKRNTKDASPNCFIMASKVQMTIAGAEFMKFGQRKIEDFGTLTPDLLKDKALTHPNLELRLAFMNYYLNPTDEKWSQISNYLYEREVAPVHRQEMDPRINQSGR